MKTKYYCEYCDKEFTEEEQCRLHEKDCAAVPGWIVPGNHIANTFGEVWKIEEYVDSDRGAVVSQVPAGVGNGSYPVRKFLSVAQIVSGYDQATVTRYNSETLPINGEVYIPGYFSISGLKDDCVVLTAVFDKEATLTVPLKHLHRLCAHAGTEIPAAAVTVHDDRDGEEYALLELVDRGCN